MKLPRGFKAKAVAELKDWDKAYGKGYGGMRLIESYGDSGGLKGYSHNGSSGQVRLMAGRRTLYDSLSKPKLSANKYVSLLKRAGKFRG